MLGQNSEQRISDHVQARVCSIASSVLSFSQSVVETDARTMSPMFEGLERVERLGVRRNGFTVAIIDAVTGVD